MIRDLIELAKNQQYKNIQRLFNSLRSGYYINI